MKRVNGTMLLAIAWALFIAACIAVTLTQCAALSEKVTVLQPSPPCETPAAIKAPEQVAQAVCDGWDYALGFDRETLLLVMTTWNGRVLSYIMAEGSPQSVTIGTSDIVRLMQLSGNEGTHILVMHNHVRGGYAQHLEMNQQDVDAMQAIKAAAMREGVSLADFVVVYPDRMLSAKAAGYL